MAQKSLQELVGSLCTGKARLKVVLAASRRGLDVGGYAVGHAPAEPEDVRMRLYQKAMLAFEGECRFDSAAEFAEKIGESWRASDYRALSEILR